MVVNVFFFSSRRRHTRCSRDWSSDVCSSDLYNGVPSLLAGLANGEWDAAFAFDQTLEPPGITAAIPHIAVENTYLVRGDAPFQKVADVDAPGVRISVAEGNSPDIYLSHTLKYATDRKSTRLNSSHGYISYAVFCL